MEKGVVERFAHLFLNYSLQVTGCTHDRNAKFWTVTPISDFVFTIGNTCIMVPLTYTKRHEKRLSHTVTQCRFCICSFPTGVWCWRQCGTFPMVRHTVSRYFTLLRDLMVHLDKVHKKNSVLLHLYCLLMRGRKLLTAANKWTGLSQGRRQALRLQIRDDRLWRRTLP